MPKAKKTPAKSAKNEKPKKSATGKKQGLVIVESPSKAKTIQKYLGRNFIVKASVGHIKDLPKSQLGVDLDHDFKPVYQTIKGKDKVIEDLKEAAERVDAVYLAPDPDREGEAIAWHIAQEMPKKMAKVTKRVLFNAITKASILEALNHPIDLDVRKFHSQQARRILDRLVGYKISPLLWDKVRRGLSAGRVQSVAVKMIVDRESEIKKFKAEEYWTIDLKFQKDQKPFIAKLAKINGEDPVLPNEATVRTLVQNTQDAPFVVSKVETKERSRKPLAPFNTSKLQQEASSKFGFSAKKTMTIAQKLYEGIDLGEFGTHGLITYMRTDSVRIIPEAITEVRAYIEKNWGTTHLPSEPIVYKSRKSAQDAHEAIRPTSLEFHPSIVEKAVDRDEFRLYQLIFNRFVSCQMANAVYDQTSMELTAVNTAKETVLARVSGSKLKFAGFTAVYEEAVEESTDDHSKESSQELPDLTLSESYRANEFLPKQHFTQPPPRFSDASLVKALEENGIGRPSTYAAILSNIQDREYVEKRENRYYPSELGIVVTDLLEKAFPDIMNLEFTAAMENKLDGIEEGNTDWVDMMHEFWTPFSKTLERAKLQMKDIKSQEIPTKFNCEKCNAVMVIKWGKLGQFLACSNYPDCKQTADFKKDEHGEIYILEKQKSGKQCQKCNAEMLIKEGKFGKFLACERYPECKSTEAITIGVHCPTCKEGEITQRMSRFKRFFYGCNRYPNCTFASWDKPVARACPTCHYPILLDKNTKRDGHYFKCGNKECDYREQQEDVAEENTAAQAATA